MTLMQTTFAPGTRVMIRDEEWLVKRSLPTSTGTTAVNVVGLSELVRNHKAVFLADLENITELSPEETKLVPDDSPQYRRSRLYLESLLRRTPPTDDKIYIGHQGALDYAPFQIQMKPAHQALQALRPRILIADGVGLGKTVEVGVLVSELIKRGRGERILVVAIKSMLAQFQEELWARFSIPLVRLDSIGLQRVRSKIPSNKNPFYYYNRVIISVDTLKNDAQYRNYLEQCHWDIIIIDECHNVANTGSMRNRLASLLARTCDSLLLTSATPHNGRSESFANLMNMLEPTAIADEANYTAEEIDGLFVRRFKKDIEDQVADAFSDRETQLVTTDATPTEEQFFDRLATASFRTLHRGRQDALYRIGLLKELGVTAKPDSPRLIIFSERLKTLQFLQDHLMAELGIGDDAIIQFHAGLRDVAQQDVVEAFGNEDSPIRILLASDVASEGVNLHYYCHLMVHFDIPWSLITLEQRNGRIDRYGQHTPPIIHYLLTRSRNEELRGDLRVLDKLIEKEQEAHKNLGDAATILQLYEAKEEDKHITEARAAGKDAEEILPDAPVADWLAMMTADTGANAAATEADVRRTLPSLYADDLAFVQAAFAELGQAKQNDNGFYLPEFHPDRPEFTFRPPEDLQRRLEFVPQEALPNNGAFHLTTDRPTVMKAMAEARKKEKEWPQTQLLWELHPVMEWITDQLLIRFGRHEAPLILTPKLGENSIILLFQGIISNQRSQPLITDWYGLLLRKGGGKGEHLTLEEVMAQTGFDQGIPNPLQPTAIPHKLWQELKKHGVKLMTQYMQQKRQERGQALGQELRQDLRQLTRWYQAARSALAANQMNAAPATYARLEREKAEVQALYDQRKTWLNETLKAVEDPYLRLVMTFTGS